MTTPSELYLLSGVDLDPQGNYTIDFDDLAAQTAYFDGFISDVLTDNEDYSYIRLDQPIKVYRPIDELEGCDYLFFNNGNKRYYAFIKEKTYISATTTQITFAIDYFQTFMFDYSLAESFVDREHQDRWNSSRMAVFNRETENLERGSDMQLMGKEKIYDNVTNSFILKYKDTPTPDGTSTGFVLMWATIVCKEPAHTAYFLPTLSSTYTSDLHATTINGMTTNTYTYVMPLAFTFGTWVLTQQPTFAVKGYSGATNYIGCATLDQFLNLTQNVNVISMNISRYCPFEYGVEETTLTSSGVTRPLYIFYPITNWSGHGIYPCAFSGTDSPIMGGFFIYQTSFAECPLKTLTYNDAGKWQLDEVPSIEQKKDWSFETKLYTSDYMSVKLEFGQLSKDFDMSDFDTRAIAFNLVPSYGIYGATSLVPLNYKGMAFNTDNRLQTDGTLNEMPLRTDAWLTYYSQNKAQLTTGFVTDAVGTAVSLATGFATMGLSFLFGGANQLVSYGSSIANKIAQINDLKNTPDEVSKTSMDMVNDFLCKDLYATIAIYTVREQFRDKCFEYFYHYGYKCNTFKTPNLRSRYYFNYIKTTGANIKGNLTSDQKAVLREIYDNGITIFHYRDASTFKGINNFEYENVEMTLLGS